MLGVSIWPPVNKQKTNLFLIRFGGLSPPGNKN